MGEVHRFKAVRRLADDLELGIKVQEGSERCVLLGVAW
jgi:hypothetical protein